MRYMNSWKLPALIFLFIVLLYVGADYVLRFHLILPEFSTLERREAQKDINSIVDAIRREANHLSQIAGDWAIWDDMYDFVQNGNKDFVTSNFQWQSLNASGIDLIYILNPEGKIVWGGIHDPVQDKDLALTEFPTTAFSRSHYLLKHDNTGGKFSGFILTGHGPMLISSNTILTSSRKGPSQGTLIMGRFLGTKTIRELARQTRISFSIKDQKTSTFTTKEQNLLNRLVRRKNVCEEINDTLLREYAIIPDLQGTPALLVSANIPRDIMQHGKATARLISFFMLSIFIAVYFFLVIWFALFKAESHRRQKRIENLVDERTMKLKENEERLRTLINATPDIICFKDDEGRWLEANQADLELFHLTNINYRGKKDSDLAEYAHPIFRDAFLCCEESDTQAWERGQLSRAEEYIPTLGGQIKIYDVIKVPIFHTDGRRKGLIVFGRDITEKKILRDKLQKAEKMEAIGLMAGGVAHDLNNILSGIIGYPELLLMQLPKDSDLRQPIAEMLASGKRASEVVDDLLTVARGVAAVREISNLNTLINEYIESPEFKKLQALYPNIIFETELYPKLSNISCSMMHIKKCLMNLTINAAEAINESGKIIISTRNQYINEPLAGNQYITKGEYAVVKISDTGSGISQKDIEHIFEPFYTKKVMGKSGTGLGLAVVWNTVQDHGGGILVTSDDKGTIFELYFPCTLDKLTKHDEDVKIKQLHGHGEKILVVDDEPQQQDIAIRMLTTLGYHVNSVNSGEEAIEYLKEKTVDLVVLDMIMEPGMSGSQTFEHIIKIHPGQKAIIVSGFSDNDEVKRIQKLGAGQFVKKPYGIKKLGMAVNQSLADLILNRQIH